MGDGPGLREFKFKITRPYDTRRSIKVELIGAVHPRHNEPFYCYVSQVRWWPWLEKINIEFAKKRVIKKYHNIMQPNEVWVEGCKSGPYKENAEDEIL